MTFFKSVYCNFLTDAGEENGDLFEDDFVQYDTDSFRDTDDDSCCFQDLEGGAVVCEACAQTVPLWAAEAHARFHDDEDLEQEQGQGQLGSEEEQEQGQEQRLEQEQRQEQGLVVSENENLNLRRKETDIPVKHNHA